MVDGFGTPKPVPFVFGRAFSKPPRKLGKPLDELEAICLLGALGGSSSSLLKVKSMIWPIGLLPLAGRGAADNVDCSLDEAGGVHARESRSEADSALTAAIRGISLISTKSSSSSQSERSLFRREDLSACEV